MCELMRAHDALADSPTISCIFSMLYTPSNIQIGDLQGVFLDEVAAGFDDVAHQGGKHGVGVVAMGDLDLQQGAGFGVQGGFPQLIGIHFPQALIALDRQAFAAGLDDLVDQADGPGDAEGLVLDLQGGPGAAIDFLQMPGHAVQFTGFAAAL